MSMSVSDYWLACHRGEPKRSPYFVFNGHDYQLLRDLQMAFFMNESRDVGIRGNVVELMHKDRMVATFNFTDGWFSDDGKSYIMDNDNYRIAFYVIFLEGEWKWHIACPTLSVK